MCDYTRSVILIWFINLKIMINKSQSSQSMIINILIIDTNGRNAFQTTSSLISFFYTIFVFWKFSEKVWIQLKKKVEVLMAFSVFKTFFPFGK